MTTTTEPTRTAQAFPTWATVLFLDGTFNRRLVFRHALTGRLYVYRSTGMLSTRVYIAAGESACFIEQ
jgi:hypothetical protein